MQQIVIQLHNVRERETSLPNLFELLILGQQSAWDAITLLQHLEPHLTIKAPLPSQALILHHAQIAESTVSQYTLVFGSE